MVHTIGSVQPMLSISVLAALACAFYSNIIHNLSKAVLYSHPSLRAVTMNAKKVPAALGIDLPE